MYLIIQKDMSYKNNCKIPLTMALIIFPKKFNILKFLTYKFISSSKAEF